MSANENMCRDIALQVSWELNAFVDKGDLEGLFKYLEEGCERVGVITPKENKEYNAVRVVMYEENGMMVCIDTEEGTIKGEVNGEVIGFTYMDEGVTEAVDAWGKNFWETKWTK